MSACWDYMEYIQKRLRNMEFTPEGKDPCGGIRGDAIVIRKPQFAAKLDEGSLPHIVTPGLVITPPKTISAPAELGTNNRDDIWYPILVQLVDTDGNEREQNLRTYLKWTEKIRKAFHCHSITDVPVEVGCGNSYATSTDTVDEKLWVREQKFVSGVVVAVRSRETRGIEL